MKEREKTFEAYILVGSNIEPESNLLRAVARLRENTRVNAISSVWETHAVGSLGPNFLNCVVRVSSDQSQLELKTNLLAPIETELGRERSSNKFAPRTIDLDIILFNNEILEPRIWEEIFIAAPLSELLPDLRNPANGETLMASFERLSTDGFIKKRVDVIWR